MSIRHLFTNTVIQSRLNTVSGYKQSFATVTAVQGMLQPLSREKTEMYEGKVGKMFIIYCDGALDIQEGDKLRDTNNGKYYKVKNGGVTRRTFGSIDYLGVVIEEIT